MPTTETTRQEHLDWCKRRALEYLPADPGQAVASMMSDLRKHPDTDGHAGIQLGAMMMFGGLLNSAEQARSWIEGFN